MAAAPPRTTIFLGPSLRAIRNNDGGSNFSARLESVAARYQAIIAETLPKNLTIDEWRAIFPIIHGTTFAQPGDAFLLPLRLKAAGSALAYKLEALKLPELVAIIEAGQNLLGMNPDPSDDAIREHLKARA
jgi:hypothetical protein